MLCRSCALSLTRRQEVPGRGVKPADLLIVGEAPGKSEDMRGEAFVGKSGRILNAIIEQAMIEAGITTTPTYYITNVVRCRPCDSKQGPNREPTESEALACRPLLIATFSEVRPREVILLGQIAKKHCGRLWPTATKLPHPAYMLRRGGVESPEFIVAVRAVSEIFKRLSGGK